MPKEVFSASQDGLSIKMVANAGMHSEITEVLLLRCRKPARGKQEKQSTVMGNINKSLKQLCAAALKIS